MMNLEEWLKSKLPAPVVESEEPEKSEELETEAMEEVEPEEEELTSRSKILETNAFPRVLAKILSYLDARSVKKAALVSR